MKAAVLHAFNEPFKVESVELGEPRDGEVRVKLAASGVCHSDLSIQRGILPIMAPVIIGHEGAGLVEAVGRGVKSVAPGDHVVLTWLSSCGVCRDCARARPHLCKRAAQLISGGGRMADGTTRFKCGGHDMPHWVGSFAEHTIVAEEAVVKIREDVPLAAAALVGCGVMTGVGAVLNTAKVEPGATVAVFGAGGVGLNAVQAAALAGAEKVIVVDVNDAKLKLAKEFGATHVVNGKKDDPVAAIQELTDGGAEYVFEVIGNTSVIEQAFNALRAGGKLVIVGVPAVSSQVTFPAAFFPLAEKAVLGSYYGSPRYRYDMPMILDLYMAKKLKLDELISKRLKIDDIQVAFDLMEKGEVARSVIAY
ncbi:MAG TPA: Zn-dependent alcohol dehydrogenase [Candidatus Bathyarchaeia archaeon]|nr:Zn-dependent alcohol dehydrogenase [Candidatus Bathyarchaeia archaeon]